MDGYDPQNFESVMLHMRREFGAAVFREPPRMYAIFCDLSPKLKPYGAVMRRLAERGLFAELDAASYGGDAARQARAMMKARDVLQNELLLADDRTGFFLGVLCAMYGMAPPLSPGTLQPPPIPSASAQSFTPIPSAMPQAPASAQAATPQAAPPVPSGTPQTPPMSGKSGGLAWALDSGGCLTISGRGDMDDFPPQGYHQSAAPWSARQSDIAEAVIKDGVSGIGEAAFYYCSNLRRALIPDSVTRIGYMAFRSCEGLRNLTLPKSLTTLEACAFEGCAGLTSVKIPRGVAEIPPRAFAECRNLTSVTLPDNVRSVGYRAFRDCPNLKRAYVPAGADIAPDAFDSDTVVIRW